MWCVTVTPRKSSKSIQVMATAGGLQTHLRQRFHRLQQRPCHHPLLSIIVDAPHVKNDMAVLEVEVTAVGLTFEGDGSHLEIPWGDGMVPTDGMTCYILQPHLHPATTGGFVQKWGCTNSCKNRQLVHEMS